MQPFGIYTLSSDMVYDQVVALLNSIEMNVGADIPVCIIPYNEVPERVKQEISSRPNVTIFEDWEAIRRWEEFAEEVWAAHSRTTQTHLPLPGWYRSHVQRRFAAFDGPFEKFVFFDADTLVMKPLDDVIEKLNAYDFVFNDWEHLKPEPVAALNISTIAETGLYSRDEVRSKLHCGSFFGSKRGIFEAEELAALKKRLIEDGEIEWINGKGWWDDAFLFSYLSLRSDRPQFNFTLSPVAQERTGNCANADPFVSVNNVLYNQDGMKPVLRIHYMGYSSKDFTRLSQGEDVNIPHRDVFLHYRFLKEQHNKPGKLKPASLVTKTQRITQRVVRKVKKSSKVS
jgi:hypothetical protein